MFQGYFMERLSGGELQGYLKEDQEGVSRAFQGSFKDVLRQFQG